MRLESKAKRIRAATRHPSVRGITVGRCINGTSMLDGAGQALWDEDGYIHAHAHVAMDRYRGWICVASTDDLTLTTVIHEIAHLVEGDTIHLEGWKRMVRHLGGRVESCYL